LLASVLSPLVLSDGAGREPVVLPRAWIRVVVGLALLLVVACDPGPSRSVQPTGQGVSAPQARKTITVSALNPIRGFGPWLLGSTQGGAASLANIHANTLATTDASGKLDARLATKLPSFDDGSIVVLPDGRMQVTWRLRSDVRWQDGAPFTADDVLFGWEVASDPDVPSDQIVLLRAMDRMEALDARTVAFTFKTTFFQALRVGPRDGVWPLPRHLIGETWATGDRQAFLNLPYWTTDWVHLGPFRLVEFGMGESLTFERFDDYFLGRPKVDAIVVRIIQDANALFANLQSGALDIVAEDALPDDLFAELRAEWRRTGAGMIVEKQGNWKFMSVQFDAELGRPPELSRDVRARRGLYSAIDRDAVRELLFPGFENTEADTFTVKSDPRTPVVGRPFARYPYDPTQAVRELAEVGWRRAADGRMVNGQGEQVRVDIRGTTVETKESALVADFWRQLGLEVGEEVMPPNLISDKEYRARFPGFEIVARNFGEQVLDRFYGPQASGPQNRYLGNNGGSYVNPALDRLIEKLRASVEEREQALALRDIGEILAADLPALPTYFRVRMSAVRKGVRALADDYVGSHTPGLPTRNAHLWERE
jgi:peptide/nickel transport system substrate-binding protein